MKDDSTSMIILLILVWTPSFFVARSFWGASLCSALVYGLCVTGSAWLAALLFGKE